MKKNLLSFLMLLTVLAFNTIACSHSKPITADAGLTEEAVSEGSDSAEAGSVSEDAESKAEELVGKSDEQASLDASTSESKPSEDPLLLGMDSSSSPEDQLQVAQASIPETATDSAVLPFDKSVNEPTIDASSFGAVSAKEKKARPSRRPAAKSQDGVLPAPKVEHQPTAEKPAPQKEASTVASNVDDPFADELNAPIPEHEKPKLASAEIGSFIERHAFLVTLCAVGLVFGLFIFMRRNRENDDHNLSV